MKLLHRLSLRPSSRMLPGVKGLCFAFLTTLFSLLQPLGAAGQAASPADESLLEEVQAPAGFDVTLFATPPEINYPTAITATPAGELFVGIDRNGSLDQERGRGQIVRAVDQDGDGRADQFISFVDSVDSPRGLSYDGETLYVMHPPELTAYQDVDGDGKADRSRTLISGLGFDLDFRGADHTTNGIKRGIDGWIYVAVGDYGFMKAVGADGKQLKHRGGGIVRVRPDGSEMEVVSTGLRNVYDLAIDPYLNGFVRGNTNDGGGWDVRLNHIVLGADYGYPTLYKNFSDEALPPLADYGGGSGTGALFVHEPGFPDAFNNMLYTSDWGRSRIYRHPLEAEGASFLAQQESFLEIPRPTDLSVDGRSRMYVSSWHEGKFRYAGENVGYILQLTPSGNSPPPLPDLEEADADVLLDVLASPSQVRRLQAQHEILRRRDDASLASGLKDLASGSAPLYARVAALFTLKQLQGPRSHDFLLQLAERGAAREFALRALVDRKSQLASVPSAPFLAALDAPSPRVQQQGVTGLARLGERDAADEILPLTTDPDPVLSHLAVQALVSLHAVQPALDALDSSSPALVAGALQVLKQLHDRQAVEGLISRLEATSLPAARRPILQALARLYYKEGEWEGNWWGTRPDTRGPYYEPTTWEQSDEIRPVLRKALRQADGDQLAALLSDLERNRVLPGQAASLIADASEASKVLELRLTRALVGQRNLTADLIPLLKKAAERNTNLRASVLQFLTAQEEVLPESISLLRRAALDSDLPPSLRQQALVSLSEASDARGRSAAVQTLALLSRRSELPAELQKVWQQFATQRQHAENLDTFIQLARDGRQAEQELAYGVLLNLAQTDGIQDDVRQQARQVLAEAWKSADATVPLLHAIGRLQAEGYADKVRAQLEEASSSPEVREAARLAVQQLEMEATSPSTAASSASEQIGNLAYEDVLVSVAEMGGNPQEGRRYFVQQGCQTCHTVKEGEPLKGPHLGGIAERYSRRELAESIMRPNAHIAQGFSTHWFEMEDGTRHIGFIIRESGDEVEIGNPVGSVTVLDKDDIANRGQQEDSMMPSGLVQQLTPQQLASLITYLEATE